MPRTNHGEPTPSVLGVAELIASGVPVGAFAEPNRFFQVKTGSKLHSTADCSRLRDSYPQPVYRDLRHTAEDTLCHTCVAGPTHPATVAYADSATRALRAATTLDAIDTDLAGGADLTWRHVTSARAALALVRDVLTDDDLHPDLAGYATPILSRARARHAELRTAADRRTDPEAVLRGCLIDNLAHVTNGGPDTATPPVPETGYRDGRRFVPLPALATDQYRPAGHRGLTAAAWSAWSKRMKADGDLAAARAAAQLAGAPAADDTPTDIGQLPKGPAVLTHAPGTSPWEQLLAEWRHQLAREVTELVGLWEQRYTTAVATARRQPAKVLVIDRYDRDTLTKINPSTAILGRLELAGDTVKQTCLVLAPAPVAAWLCKFGTTGSAGTYARVKVLTDAVPGDGEEVLELTLKLWNPPVVRPSGYPQLAGALTAARGILTPAGG